MQPAHRLLSAVTLALLSASSFATTTVYTTSASFLGQVASGAYTNSFNGLTNPPATAFASGGFSYTVSAPGDLYASGDFLGTNLPDEALTINFLGGNVKAVGANFFATNISDAFQAVTMTITLSDGTTSSFTPTTLADTYRGFVSTLAITSLVISSPGVSLYAGLDNLTVGVATVVPEPAPWVLAGVGLAALLLHRRRTA